MFVFLPGILVQNFELDDDLKQETIAWKRRFVDVMQFLMNSLV